MNQIKSRRKFIHDAGIYLSGLALLPCPFFPEKPPYKKKNKIDAFIRNKMEEYHIPGLAACVLKGDKTIWTGGYGYADLEAKRMMIPADTIQNIGSISKTITATAIMQLWESGEIKLDTDISGYLGFSVRNPKYPDIPITVEQLLVHRSSVNDGPAYGDSYQCGDPEVSLGDWIEGYFTPDGPYYHTTNFHTWEPGEAGPLPPQPRNYSNVGFGVLGLIVERISGMRFETYCKESIFTPLEMKQTGWHLTEIDVSRHAVPYDYLTEGFNLPPGMTYDQVLPKYPESMTPLTPGTFFPHCLYSFYNYPDGLLRTTVEDLSHFLSAYMNEGNYHHKNLLQSATIGKMMTILNDADPTQGLCWRRVTTLNKKVFWGHGGGDPGINTNMYLSQEDLTGVIVFQNSTAGQSFEIVEMLFEEFR
jgi:CubicO group peptidase (beta-lactamase class C family)